ncbi:MAG TPA: 4-alpha-glucanotransferase [Opitutaceae bacterium]
MEPAAPTWLTTRSAGVLAHISSLPGRYGIGNLGAGTRSLIDFLGRAGVRYWQICPVGPTGFGDSPYQTFSGRAGNPYFIDLDELALAALLTDEDLAPLRRLPAESVDYGRLYEVFWGVLALAYDRFAASRRDEIGGLGSLAAFRKAHSGWLEPFAAFMALKAQFGGQPWTQWPEAFRTWSAGLHACLPKPVQLEVERQVFYQYLFFGQWERLRRYAAARNVGIIGDVPIFMALDSADTWQNRAVFRLDGRGSPLAVAGVPPDYFSEAGQLWGNPLYDWEHLARTGYRWWIDRIQAAFSLYDIIRLDHFRGFETYWEIPAGSSDAKAGRWRKGPGMDFFQAVRGAIPGARIIAEDLGYIGPDVVALRQEAGLPGMKILQFAYGHDASNVNLPHFYTRDSVVYTGTHDNNTTRGWLEGLSIGTSEQVREYFQLNGSSCAWPMIRVALATASRLAIVPIQDLLDLPASSALNQPGTAEGNWQWRYTDEQLERLVAEKQETLRHWIRLFDRTGAATLRDYSEPPPEPRAH